MTGWLLASVALGGAWTRDQGEVYTKAAVDVYGASRVRVAGELEDSDGRYLGTQVSTYGEVGLSKGHPVQATASVPLVVGAHRTQIYDVFGELPVRATTVRMGDLRLGLQTALLPTAPEAPVALAGELKLPLYANGRVGSSLPTYAELFPRPGDGNIDGTAWLLGGASRGAWFVEGGAGYLRRTEWFIGWDPEGVAYEDGGVARAKVGWRAGPVLLIGAVDAVWAWRPGPTTREALTWSLSGWVELSDHWALEPRVATETWVRNASQGTSGGLGLSWRTR